MLAVSHEVLPSISFSESFLHPETSTTFPLVNMSKVSVKEIASTVVSSGKYLLLNENEELELKYLLHFEPFATMSQALIHELFDDRHSNYHGLIDEAFLSRLADKVFMHVDEFMTMLEPSMTELSRRNPQGNVQKLFHVFLLWKQKMGENATRCHLKHAIEVFSVFAGRNPLVS